MQTQPTTTPARSPIPGVIPERVTVRGTIRPTGRRRARSDPTDTLLAGILSVMREDKRRDPSSPKER